MWCQNKWGTSTLNNRYVSESQKWNLPKKLWCQADIGNNLFQSLIMNEKRSTARGTQVRVWFLPFIRPKAILGPFNKTSRVFLATDIGNAAALLDQTCALSHSCNTVLWSHFCSVQIVPLFHSAPFYSISINGICLEWSECFKEWILHTNMTNTGISFTTILYLIRGTPMPGNSSLIYVKVSMFAGELCWSIIAIRIRALSEVHICTLGIFEYVTFHIKETLQISRLRMLRS